MFHHDCLFCFHLDGDEVTHEFPWWPIIFGFPSNITGNRTLDVFHKNCVNDFDPVACTRSGLLSLLSLVTALFCAVRIFELHSPVQTNYHKLFVFYVLFLQSLLGSLEWLFGWKTQLALFSLYTRALALLIICHLYFTVACRVMNWTHDSTRRYLFSSPYFSLI
ncbi:hypothetical protein AB6A40_007972 [Gnathostoma spinigerum]|uniref:Uncharacterized protein n=1 Tax=Gnathostoma spinigerum TaxID=75299 RepID=A0ABD6EMT4_9BILA